MVKDCRVRRYRLQSSVPNATSVVGLPILSPVSITQRSIVAVLVMATAPLPDIWHLRKTQPSRRSSHPTPKTEASAKDRHLATSFRRAACSTDGYRRNGSPL